MKKLILTFALCAALSGCWDVSHGSKIGILVKCAKEGILIPTYECEIVRGGLTNGSGTLGQSFHFTVEDKKLIPIANDAFNRQKEIKLDYHQELLTLFRTETKDNSFADNIEIIKK